MIKQISPSLFNAYNICPRQAWLMSRQLTADQDNMYLGIGRLIEEFTFEREKKRIYLADIGAMLDIVLKKNGHLVVAEIKKSSKTMKSGLLQLKYYLYLLKKKKGIDVKGQIKIPKEKINKDVELTVVDEEKIEKILIDLKKIIKEEKIPEVKRINVCPKCGHSEFCWS